MERAFNIFRSNSSNLDNILYYLIVYGHSYIPGDNKPFKMTYFIVAYQASFETFFSVNFPRDLCSFDKFFQRARWNARSSDKKIKSETQSILCERYKEEELPEMWINGDFVQI